MGNKEGLEAFHRMAVEALKGYSDDILEKFIDPREGVMRNCKFMPSISEMIDWAERAHRKAWENAEQDRLDMNRSLIEGPKEGKLSPEKLAERERVKEGFRKLLAQLQSVPDPIQPKKLLSKAEERAQAEAWLEQQAERAKIEPLPKLSPNLLRTLRGENV
jgi:ABC-type proline/glycine betaine transport system substrate-binding protein